MLDFWLVASGLAFLMLGVKLMAYAADVISSNTLTIFKNLSPLKMTFLGFAITAVMQSSSAVTTVVSVLCGRGFITLIQSFCAVVGANIGTTSTAWLSALIGITTADNVIYTVCAVTGLILMLFKNKKANCIGLMLSGLTLFLIGAGQIASPSAIGTAQGIAQCGRIQALLYGMLLTVAVQSSSAGLCILQAVSITSSLPLMTAIYAIAGMNIGACSTAVLAALTDKSISKTVPLFNVFFNLFTAVLFITAASAIPCLNTQSNPIAIASAHSLYNIFGAIVFIPVLCIFNKRHSEKNRIHTASS